MNVNGVIAYIDGEFLGVDNIRSYEGLDGAIYFIGANANLERLYNVINGKYTRGEIEFAPRYEVHPLMNMNRNYGLEIRDGKFCIVTAEKLVERILKW